MKIRWRIAYAGRASEFSVAGVVAPSWHNFDCRVWEGGGYELKLTNLQEKAPKKIATYKVTLRRGAKLLAEREGHDWQKLVRELKREAEKR